MIFGMKLVPKESKFSLFESLNGIDDINNKSIYEEWKDAG